ncbi:MAG: YhcH/YjgK/YiaL family protein [Clostridiales bacterium]|nr:YhcH/YjgK/YiaL family protein [Clostridiales bacterium]
MIYTELSDVKTYLGIHKNLDKALEYIATKDLLELSLGKNEVDGEEIYVNRMSYQTVEEQDSFYEAHMNYIDIHLVLEGSENILVSDIRNMTEVKRELENDFIEYQGKREAVCNMKQNKVLILYPSDAHMVKVKDEVQKQVEKVVVKVKIK